MAGYLATAEVAEMLKVGEEWVREHVGELGGIRLGDSPRGPLRFERGRVVDAMEVRRLVPPRLGRRRRPGPTRRFQGGVKLLPLPPATAQGRR